MSHAHQDTTPAPLVEILQEFGELFPLSRHGPMGLILVDHAMDEQFLEYQLREREAVARRTDNSPTTARYSRAECGLLRLLLSFPEDLRMGVGEWGPIHALHVLPDVGEDGEDDEKAPPDMDALEHPDDAPAPDEETDAEKTA